MARHSLALLLLVGCSGSEPQPANTPQSGDNDLQRIRETMSIPRTLRVRFRGEWPYAVDQMPKTVTGTILLGEDQRAKISMSVATAFGKVTAYEAICDGTKLWRNPKVAAGKFNPGPTGLRVELLYALCWHGLGWAFPHGTYPSTLGEGYVVLDMVPRRRDVSPSRLDRPDGDLGVINHSCANVDYRIRLTFDPQSGFPRKRELIGDQGKPWYVETYEVEQNPKVSDDEFKLPE